MARRDGKATLICVPTLALGNGHISKIRGSGGRAWFLKSSAGSDVNLDPEQVPDILHEHFTTAQKKKKNGVDEKRPRALVREFRLLSPVFVTWDAIQVHGAVINHMATEKLLGLVGWDEVLLLAHTRLKELMMLIGRARWIFKWRAFSRPSEKSDVYFVLVHWTSV